ncbi:hypothetical protein A9B99_15455 [Mangrovibacter phragmitis]|uniref:RNA polymerase subunit sigma-70 n=1 Tax=Mangrovibacter phragmitis TaxID=1691903 RepID=A0A1B7KZ05_9ENTR|nr:sigma-70 family RNA polymerase sigma factor [Mangrovibacter phragmitis]OAT75273.1 hypothetical protein A9B99_15455 [Mangrovibacter phragmitis]
MPCVQRCVPPCLTASWGSVANELRRWLLARLPAQTSVDDVMQEVFLRALSTQENFCTVQNPRAWFYQVARHYLADTYRRGRHFIPLEQVVEGEPAAPEAMDKAVIDQLAQQCLPRVLSELAEADSDIVRYCDLQGMTVAEYAVTHQLSLPAAKSRLLRARQRLYQLMRKKCQVQTDPTGAVCQFVPRDASSSLIK